VSTLILSRNGAALAAWKTKRHSDLSEWQFQPSPQKSSWVLLRKTIEKAALAGDNFRIGSDLVYFYDQVRTDFEENG
jgi:hypothetical protein